MIASALTLRSDERLALQVAGGNDAAFAALYRRYEATLLGYCRSITRNADDAGDALQNAMLKALLALRREERSAPLRPWLFRIAHNEAVNQITRRPLVVAAQPDGRDQPVAGADEQVASREQMAELVADLRELPIRQRAALVMRELADLEYEEIAVALDVTENNARQLVFAARASLKDRQAGRALACESVRDMVLYADARRLRRRTVRSHLRTCEGCRAFAEADPRKPLAKAAGLAPWGLIEGFLRLFGAGGSAGAGAIVTSGGTTFLKTATVAAVAAAGLGVADAARPEHEAAARPARQAAVEPAPVTREADEVATAAKPVASTSTQASKAGTPASDPGASVAVDEPVDTTTDRRDRRTPAAHDDENGFARSDRHRSRGSGMDDDGRARPERTDQPTYQQPAHHDGERAAATFDGAGGDRMGGGGARPEPAPEPVVVAPEPEPVTQP